MDRRRVEGATMTTLEPITGRHPILSPATLNYREDCGYSAVQERRNEGEPVLLVRHTVTGEKCLVKDLLRSGHAKAMCTVVAPWAMYRKTFLSEAPPGLSSTGEKVLVVQRIPVHTDEFEPPIKMQPAIVIVDPPPPIVLGEEHGVDELWHGAEIVFEKGAILTDHPWWETQLGESILKVVKAHEEELKAGSYEVNLVPEQGFFFQMKVSPDLYESMRHPGSTAANAHVQSLYAAALSEGFVLLRRDYRDPDEWQNYSNLRSLHAHLKQQNLPVWYEGADADFRPNQIVAVLAPHEIFNTAEPESDQMGLDLR